MELSGRGAHVIATWCWSCQEAVLVSLGHGTCAVVTWYLCHQDAVLASLGGSVLVSGLVLSGHSTSVLGGGDGGYVDKEVNTNDAPDVLEKKPHCGHSYITIRLALQRFFRC